VRRRAEPASVSIPIVDDEPDVAELCRRRFRCDVRQGLCHALRQLGRGGAGGGLIDHLACGSFRYQMPGMDGLQLLSEIKQRYPALPVMVVTAYGEEERRRLLNERLYQLSTAMTGTTLLDRMTANPPPPSHPWVGRRWDNPPHSSITGLRPVSAVSGPTRGYNATKSLRLMDAIC